MLTLEEGPPIPILPLLLHLCHFKVNRSYFLSHVCHTIAGLFLEQWTYCYWCKKKPKVPLRLKATTAEGLRFCNICNGYVNLNYQVPPPWVPIIFRLSQSAPPSVKRVDAIFTQFVIALTENIVTPSRIGLHNETHVFCCNSNIPIP